MAAMFKLTFPEAPDPPLVVRSTTTMAFPVLEGALGVSVTLPVPEPCPRTTNVIALESVPSEFCNCTARFAADCRSAALSEAVHCVVDMQDVARAVPLTRIVEPGPGTVAEKLFPMSSTRKPPAVPAHALVRAKEKKAGFLPTATVAVADWRMSSE